MLGLKRFDHVGVIVEDLAASRALLEDEFGLTYSREVHTDDFDAVFLRSGDAAVELIQMKDPERNRQRMAGNPAARIEHIALEVDSLDATLQALEALGIALNGPAQQAGVYRSVWTRPETSGGVMYQFMAKGES